MVSGFAEREGADGHRPSAPRVHPRVWIAVFLAIASATIGLGLVVADVIAMVLRFDGRPVSGAGVLMLPGFVVGVTAAVAAIAAAGPVERRIWASDGAFIGERQLGAGRLIAKISLGVVGIAVIVMLLVTQWDGLKNLGEVYLKPEHLRDSWPSVRKGFWLNIKVFVIAELLVLIWALIVAVLKTMPGAWAGPVRWLMSVYVDLFRGIPAIIAILLIGLGLPTAKIPLMDGWEREHYAILALTLVYGAYVAEVYRAGIESVHPSQVAAARSLGLSHGQTMQYVVVPQAVRRVIPPLLNDFIGLQKDTALIGIIGALDAVKRATFYNSSNSTFAGHTVAAVLFLVMTIPLARFTDSLIKRDRRRTQAAA